MPKHAAVRMYASWAALFALALGFWLWAIPRQPRLIIFDAPIKVSDGTDFAERAVPGWRRAEAAGRVQTLDVSAPIPGTDAVITLEKAWVTEPNLYILYTVSAPDGGYLKPQSHKLGIDSRFGPYRMPGLQLQRYYDGGVSKHGYHDVLRHTPMDESEPPLHEAYEVVVDWWAKPVPGTNRVEYRHGGEVVLPIALAAPADEVWHTVPLGYELEWQGREMVIEELTVGFESTRVTASATLLPEETDPSFGLEIHYGRDPQSVRVLKHELAEPDDSGRYRFVKYYEPPDEWPVTITLSEVALEFRSPDSYELDLPWGAYRSDDRIEVSQADRVSVQIHDTKLSLFAYGDYGRDIVLEDTTTRPKPPHVTFASMLEATIEGDRGTVFIAPGGEIISNYQAGSGDIWNRGRRWFREQSFYGHSAHLREEDIVTGSWVTADRLRMRIIEPWLRLTFDGTWELNP